MKHLTSIVALNQDCVIGAQNRLPWRIRADLQFFRDQTSHNVVIMGRKTFDSLGRRPLPNRKNIVVTHGFKMFPGTPDCFNAGSIPEALATADQIRTQRQRVFVIGGASMYEQFAPFVDRYLISEVKKEVSDGDTFFDVSLIGPRENWRIKKLLDVNADSDGNEAPFKTFELVALEGEKIRSHREKAIADFHHMRRRGNEYQTLGGMQACAVR